jgi:DNA-binding NarL/FixJ family response regulator
MKVVIADDHPLVRDALARVVQQIAGDVEVRTVGDHAALHSALAAALPDLVIVDLNMPGTSGLEMLRAFRERYPALTIVVASGQDDPATIRAVLATGAHGFIPKSEPPEVLVHALQLVLAGGVYIPPRTLERFGDVASARPTDFSGFTPRQQDVLRLLLKGEPNKAIARQLGLTEGTVKIHIAAILRGMQVRNRTEAVIRARELGFG